MIICWENDLEINLSNAFLLVPVALFNKRSRVNKEKKRNRQGKEKRNTTAVRIYFTELFILPCKIIIFEVLLLKQIKA